MLNFDIDKSDAQKLIAFGADKHALGTLRQSSFEVEDALLSFKPKIEAVTSRTVSVKAQEEYLAKLLENPYKDTGISVINSYPTDLRARHIAVNIMHRAVELRDEMNAERNRLLGKPIWHKVFGGYRDSIRDSEDRKKPSLLILSNITPDATPVKLEKLRDLLEMHDSIPRIVVTGGLVDPITFFGTRLHLPVKYVCHFGSNSKVSPLDI